MAYHEKTLKKEPLNGNTIGGKEKIEKIYIQ